MTKTRRRYKNHANPAAPKQPAGQPADKNQPRHRVGETKTVGGVTYRLNQNHRWELASHDDPAQAHGAEPIQPGDVDRAQQAIEFDHKQRAGFVAKQLGQVDQNVAGLMRAMQAAPEFQRGAEYATKQIHPKQAGALYAYLQQNAGQQVSGGEVRDLGNGNLGFSSAAGAIVVSAPGADGRHQVHYTAKTGVVDRAMQRQGGGQQKENVPTGQAVQSSRSTQPRPEGQSNVATQQGDGPVLSSESDDASQLRIAAEDARADYENAIADWEKAAKNAESGGKAGWFKENGKWVKKTIPTVADRKVLAQHRSKVASLRTIWKDKQSAVDQHGKRQAAAAKQAAKGKAADAAGDATPEERELMQKTGLSLAQARRMMEPPKPPKPRQQKHSPSVQKALQTAAAALGVTLGGQAASPPEVKADAVSQADTAVDEWKTPEGGGGPIPEVKRAWAPDSERWKQDLHGHLQTHGLQSHPDNLAAIQKAVEDGHITSHDQLKRVLARAKKLHDRSGKVVDQEGNVVRDTPALRESLRRRRERSERGPRQNFDEHVKQAANDFGMDEGSMRNIVDQVWGEKKKFYDARESAKAQARKMLGVNRGTMNALERQNKDDLVDEDGEVARELAREYPELGMPDPDHYDGGDFDYSAAMQELLKEGPQPPPSNTSPEFWQEVSDFIHGQDSGSAETSITPEERERLDSVPFSKWGHDYRKLLYARARAKSSPGQRGMFDENKHPRDDAGRFSEADALAASVAIEQHPVLQSVDLFGDTLPAPKPAKMEFGSTGGKQSVLFSTAGLPGQMNIFGDTGVPDELVSKEGREAEAKESEAAIDAPSPAVTAWPEKSAPTDPASASPPQWVKDAGIKSWKMAQKKGLMGVIQKAPEIGKVIAQGAANWIYGSVDATAERLATEIVQQTRVHGGLSTALRSLSHKYDQKAQGESNPSTANRAKMIAHGFREAQAAT